MMSDVSSAHPSILLGTAMWGWTTTQETAFELLDTWYELGYREVDGATNYPIDKDPAHFRRSEHILLEWIKAHGVQDLSVMMKIGSVNNLRTPEHVLTQSFVLMMLDEYRWLFGDNLATLMVHWDNRNEPAAIRETLLALDVARQQGLQIGLSGIRHPEIYAELNESFGFDFRIQLKHNVLQSDYGRYAPFHGKRRFIAYGINAGGLKLDTAAYSSSSSLVARGANVANLPPAVDAIWEVIALANEVGDRPRLSAMHEMGMIYAFYQPDMKGILLGVSNVGQLRESAGFLEILKTNVYRDVYGLLMERFGG